MTVRRYVSDVAPSCEVFVDGVRVNDDVPTEADALDPVALDGLRITWGRDTTFDQPEPAALTMRLRDPEGGRAFIEDWHVGSLVTVEAVGPPWLDTEPGEPIEGRNILPWAETFTGVSQAEVLDHWYSTGGRGWGGDYWPRPVAVEGGTVLRIPMALQGGTGQVMHTFSEGVVQNPLEPGDPAAWDGLQRFGDASTKWVLDFRARSWHNVVTIQPGVVANRFASNTSIGGAGAAFPADGQWYQRSVEFPTRGWDQIQAWWPVAVMRTQANPTWLKPGTFPRRTWQEMADDGDTTTWAQLGYFEVDDIRLRPDVEEYNPGNVRVLVFSGRVTDLSLSLDDDDRPEVAVTAMDIAAELTNRVIGDDPWPAETVTARANRIMAKGAPDTRLIIEPGYEGTRLSYLDVDARDVLGLLREVAASIDHVLWAATHPLQGAYLRMENMGAREPLFMLTTEADTDGKVWVRIRPTGGVGRVLRLSACNVLADPVAFESAVADVVNTLALTWLEQTTDEAGKPAPTERTIVNADAPSVAALGTRRMSVSTLLSTQSAAVTIAGSMLARSKVTDWRVTGLSLDGSLVPPRDRGLVTRLLDGTARNGLPVFVTDLPGWVPATNAASLYIEGGTYTYEEGRWTLDLTASAAQAVGEPLTWVSIGQPYTWAQFHPTIAWQDLAGVRGPA